MLLEVTQVGSREDPWLSAGHFGTAAQQRAALADLTAPQVLVGSGRGGLCHHGHWETGGSRARGARRVLTLGSSI